MREELPPGVPEVSPRGPPARSASNTERTRRFPTGSLLSNRGKLLAFGRTRSGGKAAFTRYGKGSRREARSKRKEIRQNITYVLFFRSIFSDSKNILRRKSDIRSLSFYEIPIFAHLAFPVPLFSFRESRKNRVSGISSYKSFPFPNLITFAAGILNWFNLKLKHLSLVFHFVGDLKL